MSTLEPSAGRPRRPLWQRRMTIVAIVAAVAAAVASGATGLFTPAHAATPPTIVSLTFDDANADQVPAAQTLVDNGLRGTFFINSGFLNAPGYMTNAQVQALAAAGHEIGGHTVNHPSLTAISTAEAQRQICLDRTNLTNLGLSVTDFAYPFSDENTAVEQVVKGCGYNSARGLGDIRTRFGCSGCAYAETIPPKNAYDTAALDEVESTWTLADLESPVTNAAKRGGWVQYTFHHICPAGTTCADPQMTSALYGQFITWLGAKVKASGGTLQVKTVAQVINQAAKPVVGATYPAPAAAGVNAVTNPSLETADTTTGNPQCFAQGGYGTNTPAFSASSAAHTGTKAEQLVMSGYSDGDAKLLPTLDLGQCAPTVVPGHTYSLREWYTSSVVTQFAVYIRNDAGAWTYWTSSPWFAATSTYTQATWTTPAIPAGTTGISFGLNLFSNGTLVTDDWSMYDTVGAPAVSASASSTRLAPSTATRRIPGAQKKGTVQVPDAAKQGEQP